MVFSPRPLKSPRPEAQVPRDPLGVVGAVFFYKAWQLLPCPLKEYMFKYIVGAREARTLAMTRGWGLDVSSIARSISRCLACPCVVPGRARSNRPVPTVLTRLRPLL